MTELCSTCLCSDRRLTPLSSISNVLAVIKWTDVKWNMSADKVCWECLAILKRVEGFKKQVLLAHYRLQMYKGSGKHSISLKSMSTLSPRIVNTCADVKPSLLQIDIKIEEEECESFTDNDFETPSLKLENINNEIKLEENNANQFEIMITPNNDELSNDYDEKLNKSIIESEGHNSNQMEEFVNSEDDKPDNSHEVKKNCEQEAKKPTDDEDMFTIVPMTIDEMLKTRDLDKQRPMYKKSPYKCFTCITGYYAEDKLEKHNSIKHHEKMGPYKCQICEERFNQVQRHSLHYASHFRRYHCRQCEFTHHRIEEIQKHVNTIHELKNYDCYLCDMSFVTRGQCNYHRRACHKEKCTCTICGKTCANPTNLKIHMTKHVPAEQCPQCGNYYKFLKLHIKNQHPAPDARRDEAYCAECDMRFRSFYIYRNHLKNHSRHRDPNLYREQHPCDQCDSKFYRKIDLTRHVAQAHDKRYPFCCDYCHKGYRQKKFLEQHILELHMGMSRPKNNICTVCGKGFKDKKVLNVHSRIHTGEKPFKCELCPWRFTQNGTLYTHMRGKHPEAYSTLKKKEKIIEKKNEMVKKKEKNRKTKVDS